MTMGNPAADELRARLGDPAAPSVEPVASPVPDVGHVNVTLDLPDGSRQKGTFIYRVPVTTRAVMEIGIAAARQRRGVSPEALDATTATMAHVAGYMEVVLLDPLPPWAAVDGKLSPDLPTEVVFNLYEVVRKHEAMFRRGVRIT